MEDEEVMELFEDADFPDEEIEDTNDDASKEKGDDSEEANDDETDTDDVDPDDTDEEDLEDDTTKKDDEPNLDTPTPKTFKVMVNHEEKEVSETDENFISYLQKGLDYDRVKDQVNTYKNDPRLSFVENQAKKYNMTPEQFISAVQDQEYQSEIDDLVKSGVTEEVAKEVVDTRRQKQPEPQSQKQEDKELVDFVEYYAKTNGKTFNPDTDTLPDEVWVANANGTPLKVAYMEHLLSLKQAEQKLSQKQEEQKKQNEEAKKKAPVKGVSNSGPGKSLKKDPLFDGLFED